MELRKSLSERTKNKLKNARDICNLVSIVRHTWSMFSFDNLIRFILIFSKYKPNVEYQQSSIEEVTYCNMFVFARYAV